MTMHIYAKKTEIKLLVWRELRNEWLDVPPASPHVSPTESPEVQPAAPPGGRV